MVIVFAALEGARSDVFHAVDPSWDDSQLAAVAHGPVTRERKKSAVKVVSLTAMAPDVPVLLFASVAVMVVDSVTASLVLIENVPAVRVFVLSPNVESPLLSNCMLPDALDIVTTVELSVFTVLLY